MKRDPRHIPVSDSVGDALSLRNYPGWTGSFARTEAPGAIGNGKRIVKTFSEPRDRTPIGTTGTVLGSVRHPQLGIAYWVEWDTDPHHAIFIVAKKIGEA